MQIAKLILSLQRVQNRTRAKDTKKGAIVQILKLKEDERKYRDKGMGNQRLQGKSRLMTDRVRFAYDPEEGIVFAAPEEYVKGLIYKLMVCDGVKRRPNIYELNK